MNMQAAARSAHVPENRAAGISPGAFIGANVIIGENVTIAPGAVIGANVILGYHEGGGVPALTEIREGAVIRSGSVVYAGCRIGRNSTVGHNSVLRDGTIIGHDTYTGTLVSVEGETVIGDHVGIQSMCYITRFCTIGDYTFIAPRFAGANDPVMSHRRAGHGTKLAGFTTEKYVRIGIGAIALPGVRFGEGCMVGAGSVVTRDVAPYTLVMGVPARRVRDISHDEIAGEKPAGGTLV